MNRDDDDEKSCNERDDNYVRNSGSAYYQEKNKIKIIRLKMAIKSY